MGDLSPARHPEGSRVKTGNLHKWSKMKKFTPSGVIRPLGGEASEKPDASGFSLK